jgi:hypothetical protein
VTPEPAVTPNAVAIIKIRIVLLNEVHSAAAQPQNIEDQTKICAA